MPKTRIVGEATYDLPHLGASSLVSRFPRLVALAWHTRKNVLTAQQVTAFSSNKAWWRCIHVKDHPAYEMTIGQRTQSWIKKTDSQGCVSCMIASRRKDKYAPLSDLLRREWLTEHNNHIRAELVNALSTGRYFWRCSRNNEHIFYARVVDRHKHNQGCPVCCQDEKLDLRANKWLEKLFDTNKNRGYDTRAIPLFHNVAWRCQKVARHIWNESTFDLLQYKDCPQCAPRDVVDLNEHRPLLEEFDIEENEGVNPVCIKRTQSASWHCIRHKRNFIAQVDHRLVGKSCPYCTNRRLCDENSIAGHDLLVASWDEQGNGDLDPAQIKATGRQARSQKYSWRCARCPNTWHETCFSILRKGMALCPDCRKQRFDESEQNILLNFGDVI